MSNREELLTPVGRLVQGSLYDAQDNDDVYKTGPKAGQPRITFYFALAIAKGTERHWSETEWGKRIWAIGHAGFPQGQANMPAFAWKITDGDDTMPNKVGKKPCDREGYPGHWVLNFSSGFAPSIYTADGSQQLLEPNYIKSGDYIQVYGNISDNESIQQPGVYLNHSMVAFAGFGDRISVGPDPKSVGFGKSALPAGVSNIPKAQGFSPAPVNAQPPSYTPPAAYVPPAAPVMPHTAILTPPSPIAPPAAPVIPQRVMTEKAQGASYDQMIAVGWTDALLIQHGMMLP